MTEDKTIGTKKPCCKNPANLERLQLQNDLTVSMCRECGCKHWEAVAEPGHIGLRFS
jgi:hypothetical protein